MAKKSARVLSKHSVLDLMCGVVAMTVLDLSVVNVALPSIQADLHARPADLQWVVVIYGVIVAGFLMLGGRTGDLAGHRKVRPSSCGLRSSERSRRHRTATGYGTNSYHESPAVPSQERSVTAATS
jgi:MFS family permease